MVETLSIAATVKKSSHAQHAAHRLSELGTGARGKVCRIEGHDGAMARLMAMGLCVGREVEVIRHGNPLIVRLLGARVGMSARIARRIVVEARIN